MNVDHARVRIRERTPTEVVDLAVVFLKANAKVFSATALALVIPGTLIVSGLTAGHRFASWYLTFVAASVVATTIRCPVVLLCGRAMFTDSMSFGAVVADTRRNLPAIASIVGRRALLSLSIVGLAWDWLARYHLEEVMLLERLSGPAAAIRLSQMRKRFGSKCQEQVALHTLLGTALLVSAYTTWVFAKMLFASDASVDWWPGSLANPAVVASLLAVQVFLATSKFLFYLNLRTVNEGWDLFLETRAIQGLLAARGPVASRALRGGAAVDELRVEGPIPTDADQDAARP